MASTVWKGHLTFGLVSIPVRLFRAARAEKISLHRLYRPARVETAEQDREEAEEEAPPRIAALNVPGSAKARAASGRAAPEREPEPEPEIEEAPVTRIRQTAIDPEANRPIPASDLLRGYEYGKNQYVVIDEEDIRKITPRTATEMQILEFVRFAEIDPLYLETSYYVAPDAAGDKAYALLFTAMRDTGYAAVAQVAMHRREHVLTLRSGKSGIIAHTLYYPDEVRANLEYRSDENLVIPKELTLAKTLIETLAAPFEPGKFKDTYRERLRELIDAKVQGRQVAQAAARPAAKVVDIMDALQKSLAAASAARKPAKSESGPVKKRQRRIK
jgi:DNA end-binding protein Ku